jgi:hypothetical protein
MATMATKRVPLGRMAPWAGPAHNGRTMTRDEAIAAITDRLVEYYHPERIYLFGSEAHAAHVCASLPATVVREGKLLYDSGPVAA